MQLRVTVALVTVCIVVGVVGVVGTSTLDSFHLTVDQYSPLHPQRHGFYQRSEDELRLKSKNKVLDQPQDYPSVALRSSIISNEFPLRISEIDSKEGNSVSQEEDRSFRNDFSMLTRKSHMKNFASTKFKNDQNEHRDVKTLGSFSLDASPSTELNDPFVADDTFHDEGPGSVEIYKLDLFKEQTLLNLTSTLNLPGKNNKRKMPKKSFRVDWKSKSMDYKPSSTKSHREQSTFSDELESESPSNEEDIGVGGVPELQVGCEGLEASSHKLKRSVDAGNEKKQTTTTINTVSINFDYDPLPYEEMDELVLLKKMETTTDKPKEQRGDMGISFIPNYFPYLHSLDKIPMRGDLGTANSAVFSEIVGTAVPRPSNDHKSHTVKRSTAEASDKFAKASVKSEHSRNSASSALVRKRKLLWDDESNNEVPGKKDSEREKRSTFWGFEENEGVVSSDELQTEERRQMHGYKKREEQLKNLTNAEIEKIREEHEKFLEQQQRETEQRWRRMKDKESKKLTSEGERGVRREQEEQRKRLYEYGRYESSGSGKQTAEESRIRWEEDRRRRKGEESKLQEEQMKRRNHSRLWQQIVEDERRKESEQNFERNLTPVDRRNFEERRKQWSLKRKQEEDRIMRDRDRNATPSSNFLRPESQASQLNFNRMNEGTEKRWWKEQTERENERKLREYIERNRPINPNTVQHPRHRIMHRNMTQDRNTEEYRRRMEEYKRRLEEERRRKVEYVRSKPPIDLREERTNDTTRRGDLLEERREIEATRLLHNTIDPTYRSQEATKRHHGPSASTYIDPRYSLDEARRKQEVQRFEEERRRMRYEVARREEEVRRQQSRRYEAERRRIEAARREDEKRRQESIKEQRRTAYGSQRRQQQLEGAKPDSVDRQQLEERRRQDAALVPVNLVLNEKRRTMERERQRQEQAAKKRSEAVARNNERVASSSPRNRTNDEKQSEEYMRLLKDQWRRREEARLNALPVSARIIIRSRGSSPYSPPVVISRDGFRNEIDFPGFNPHASGVEVAKFPAPTTGKPSARNPSACTWAILHCCPSNTNRLVTCFESLGCPGISWDGNPCRFSLMQAARDEIAKFYASSEDYH